MKIKKKKIPTNFIKQQLFKYFTFLYGDFESNEILEKLFTYYDHNNTSNIQEKSLPLPSSRIFNNFLFTNIKLIQIFSCS